MHHVIQVSRALSLCQGAHLLGEDLLERIAQYLDAFCGQVGVGVVNGPLDRRQDQHFVGSQVELDAGWITGTAKGPPGNRRDLVPTARLAGW